MQVIIYIVSIRKLRMETIVLAKVFCAVGTHLI
jgi:hypothetical protein